MVKLIQRILAGRSRMLGERVYALEIYLGHRSRQQEELKEVRDWMVRLFLAIRRIVDRGFFNFWLAELRCRRGLLESAILRLSG